MVVYIIVMTSFITVLFQISFLYLKWSWSYLQLKSYAQYQGYIHNITHLITMIFMTEKPPRECCLYISIHIVTPNFQRCTHGKKPTWVMLGAFVKLASCKVWRNIRTVVLTWAWHDYKCLAQWLFTANLAIRVGWSPFWLYPIFSRAMIGQIWPHRIQELGGVWPPSSHRLC